MKDHKKEIGERLRIARERSGMKQNRVAKAIGIHNSTLAKYESGDRELDNETLLKLAEMYNTSLQWLLTGKEETETRVHVGNKVDIFEFLEILKTKSIDEIVEQYRHTYKEGELEPGVVREILDYVVYKIEKEKK